MNKPLFFLVFSILISCSDDSSLSELSTKNSIEISSITNHQVIDEPITIGVQITGQQAEGSSIEAFVDSEKFYSAKNKNKYSIELDPEPYSVGAHKFKLILSKKDEEEVTKEFDFEINRRLITIHLPEDVLSEYIINAVVFASKMDGSIIKAEKFDRDDREIVLSSEEEFGMDEEFMLTFALKDNGMITTMSTHANLTRKNLENLSLKVPFRGAYEAGTKEYAITGFGGTDMVYSESGLPWHKVDYVTYFDSKNKIFGIEGIVPFNTHNAYYLYGNNYSGFSSHYKYLLLDAPLADDFILNKADFTSNGVETRNLSISSSQNSSHISTYLAIYGYLSNDDFKKNIFHRILHHRFTYPPGTISKYSLNTNFYEYRYMLESANYFTEGIGLPKASFEIPDVSLDYENSNNEISIGFSGDDHILGRIRLSSEGYDARIYSWDITFNSKTTSKIIIPQLPEAMREFNVVKIYESKLFKVFSAHLASYQGIVDYNDYCERVVKLNKDPLKVSDSFELIFVEGLPTNSLPIKDFCFQ